MEPTLGSALDKIKRQEQSQEAKLKAQREFEATKASLERSIRDALTQSKKYQQEELELITRTNDLSSELTIHKIRKASLLAQLEASSNELKTLQAKIGQIASENHKIRSDYCKAVQETADECDVWALLMKPSVEPTNLPKTTKIEVQFQEPESDIEDKLKDVRMRREKAVAERRRLLAEPEKGEEFVRIKNALRYSLEMTANYQPTVINSKYSDTQSASKFWPYIGALMSGSRKNYALRNV